MSSDMNCYAEIHENNVYDKDDRLKTSGVLADKLYYDIYDIGPPAFHRDGFHLLVLMAETMVKNKTK
jgi:hypothetical protein